MAALAESCTAGLAAAEIASVPGASKVFWGGFVTYSIEAKTAMLGIDRTLIEGYGAVSSETACAMACGALQKSGVDITAAVTGLAGPDGDDRGTPVGTVWIAVAARKRTETAENAENAAPITQAWLCHYDGGREAIRQAAAAGTLGRLLSVVQEWDGRA
jgi:PncC family amidohydrolase